MQLVDQWYVLVCSRPPGKKEGKGGGGGKKNWVHAIFNALTLIRNYCSTELG